jgi:arginyl-tRNA synthetase
MYHTRGVIFGDALASLLRARLRRTEYYINDGGAQVDVLARSVYLRYQERSVRRRCEGTWGDYLTARQPRSSG